MQRFGSVVLLRPEKEEGYLELHRAVWPKVPEQISASGIRNFSIFLRDGVLFSYYEYVGTDHAADMAAMSADPVTQDWWKLTGPCQQRVETAGAGEQWAPMVEVFHTD